MTTTTAPGDGDASAAYESDASKVPETTALPDPSAAPQQSDRRIATRCCVVGGGPAGIIAGYLLARAGVDVVVLEKHADFFRDFRGDTIHPSTLRIVDELGFLDEFLTLPHTEARGLSLRYGDTSIRLSDFTHVPGRCKFMALMPQWDFLNFFAARGRELPHFRLEMEAEATDLVFDGERVAGVRAQTPAGPLTIRAALVIAADGRHSLIREKAGLTGTAMAAPIDVLWMRLTRRASDPDQALGNVAPGGFFVTLDRKDYWQCAFIIKKGGFDAIRARGLDALGADIATLAPFLTDRVSELKSWDQVKLLTVAIDRLKTWYRDGLLCIGDAAHAMSPVGGVGINIAIQDAVAAANILAGALASETLANGTLASGTVETALLAKVQQRREWPMRLTQMLQVQVQNQVLNTALAAKEKFSPPAIVRLIGAVPLLQRIPAYIIGIGFRPEHVRTPARD